VAGCCENGNEPLGSVTCGELIDQLSDYYLVKKDSTELINVFLMSVRRW
jgi:hypothetical protein